MKRNLKPAARIFNDPRMLRIMPAIPQEGADLFLRAVAVVWGVPKRRLMQYWNRQYRLGRLPYPAQ